jgi:FAD/FMN-containing dehydrogenase
LRARKGTLAFITEIELNLVKLPPKEVGLLCVHFNSVDESLRANLIAMKYAPSASELIDHFVLECTKDQSRADEEQILCTG